MDRWNKIENIVGSAIFGSLGLGALIGALFCGATHQFVMAIICGAMTWALIAEIRREEKKAKVNQRNA